MKLLYKIWSPHLWFTLTSLSFSYPKNPSDSFKKKYYSLFHNLPFFYPYDKFDKHFSKILKTYPISPYLDSKQSLIKWINFVRNKTNAIYELPIMTESEYLKEYYDNYADKREYKKQIKLKKYFTITAIMIVLIIYLKSKSK